MAKKQTAAPEQSGPQKYEVIRPWAGVNEGEILSLETVHPAIKANLRKVGAKVTTSDDGSGLIESAKVEAAAIVEKAKEEAEAIKTEATAEAERIVEAAKAAPPPPPAK